MGSDLQFSRSSGITQNSAAIPADGLTSVSVDAATNRMTTASGWDYDKSGNLIRGQNASGVWQRFEYDAAGRLKKVKDDANTVLETYTYGAGREKLMVETSSERRYFAWGGQSIIAEYSEIGASTSPAYAKNYVYAGSRLLATYHPTTFSKEAKQTHHPDRLGTQLVTTGTSSSYRQTTFPFGTTITAETTGNSNQVFTSYDRSTTTGLDYAVNRTYSRGQSRFTQVDPIGMSASSLGDPQSNNLYAYVQNMPTDFVDPSGLDEVIRVYEWTFRDFSYLWQLYFENGGTREPYVSFGGGPGGGGDECIPGIPCFNDIWKEAKQRRVTNAVLDCIKKVLMAAAGRAGIGFVWKEVGKATVAAGIIMIRLVRNAGRVEASNAPGGTGINFVSGVTREPATPLSMIALGGGFFFYGHMEMFGSSQDAGRGIKKCLT